MIQDKWCFNQGKIALEIMDLTLEVDAAPLMEALMALVCGIKITIQHALPSG
ncbi:MAG: hypothetical protein ACXVDN_11405 [Ktedonobacteraceae bacterium]